MTDQQALAKVLKEAMKAGRYSLGAKEVLSNMKGSKLVICTASLSEQLSKSLRTEAAKNNVPVLDLSKTSAELGRLLGRPFRVSTVALRSVGESELKHLLS